MGTRRYDVGEIMPYFFSSARARASSRLAALAAAHERFNRGARVVRRHDLPRFRLVELPDEEPARRRVQDAERHC